MILNYDKNNGVSFIWDKFKKEIPEISSEANKFFEDLAKIQTINPNIPVDFDGFIKGGNVADESLRNFLQTTDASQISLENYQKYLESTAKSSSKLGNILSELGSIGKSALASLANIGISMAITLAIQAISKVIDNAILSLHKILYKFHLDK